MGSSPFNDIPVALIHKYFKDLKQEFVVGDENQTFYSIPYDAIAMSGSYKEGKHIYTNPRFWYDRHSLDNYITHRSKGMKTREREEIKVSNFKNDYVFQNKNSHNINDIDF